MTSSLCRPKQGPWPWLIGFYRHVLTVAISYVLAASLETASNVSQSNDVTSGMNESDVTTGTSSTTTITTTVATQSSRSSDTPSACES